MDLTCTSISQANLGGNRCGSVVIVSTILSTLLIRVLDSLVISTLLSALLIRVLSYLVISTLLSAFLKRLLSYLVISTLLSAFFIHPSSLETITIVVETILNSLFVIVDAMLNSLFVVIPFSICFVNHESAKSEATDEARVALLCRP
jgi:hypothetical protein